MSEKPLADLFHIRQRATFSGFSPRELKEREDAYWKRMAQNPDSTYCGYKGRGVYGSVPEAFAAGVTAEDICSHCAGFDYRGFGFGPGEADWAQQYYSQTP